MSYQELAEWLKDPAIKERVRCYLCMRAAGTGYTISDLSEMLDVSHATISRWFFGGYPLKAMPVMSLCRILGINYETLPDELPKQEEGERWELVE